ncbi:MAG: hypothetical protein JO336_03205, partial [Acidobacteriia bacterium]|nr:hypothetical protein [Terriglobia bacterium]
MGLRFYDFLLRLYPKEHRELFGEEMATVLRQAAEDRRARGMAAYLWFAFWEIVGLVTGAAAVWAANLAQRAGKPAIDSPPGLWFCPTTSIAETERLIQRSIDCMVHAIANHQFAKARFYSEAERRLRAHLKDLQDRYDSAA